MMTSEEFFKLAQTKVAEYNNNNPLLPAVSWKNVFIVWYAKTLQNHKALLATPVFPDAHYYEATYNGDKDELYLDVYTKELNKCYKLGDDK